MKNLALTTIFILLLSTYLKAASIGDSSKICASVCFGMAQPVGHFASTAISSTPTYINGFAKTGYTINTSIDWYFLNNCEGLSLSAGLAVNSFNSNKYASQIFSTEAFNLNATRFYNWPILLGPCIRKSISSKLTFHSRLMAGIIESSYPTINMTLLPATEPPVTNTWTFNNSLSLCFSLYAGITYSLNKHLDCVIDASYLAAYITYPALSLSQNSSSSHSLSGIETESIKIPLGLLFLSTGMIYSF